MAISTSILSGINQRVNAHRALELAANRAANVKTIAHQGVFADYAFGDVKTRLGEDMDMPYAKGTWRDVSQGSFQQTGRSFDVAISGKGYFMVETPEGMRYTRNGSFSKNAKGELVMAHTGDKVMSTTGLPIKIPQEASSIDVSRDGIISANGQIVAKIGVANFAQGDEQAMEPLGDGYFKADAQPIAADKMTIHQGVLEQSNQNSVLSMVELVQLGHRDKVARDLIDKESDRLKETLEGLAAFT